jgi:hypothetical protein
MIIHRDRLIIAAASLGFFLAITLLWTVNPRDLAWFPCCPFHLATGMFCSGCGSLRATHHLLHLRLGSALASNPLVVLFLPFFALKLLLLTLGGNNQCCSRSYPRLSWLCVALVVMFWVLRNIPAFPFSWLAPRESIHLSSASWHVLAIIRCSSGVAV